MASGTMEVTVVRARGLRSPQPCGKLDPYVVVQYKDQEQKTSRFKHSYSPKRFFCFFLRGRGGNPKWKEKFKFKVECREAENERHKLVIRIMDLDVFTEDDYIGQATIYLKEFVELGMQRGRAELPPQKYRVVSSDQTYRGEIKVGVTFTAGLVSGFIPSQ